MIDFLLRTHVVCTVPHKETWLTVLDYLDAGGQFLGEHREEFEKREGIYTNWVNQSQKLGYYAEKLFQDAFLDAGYSVQKVTFRVPAGVSDVLSGHVEIDAYCVKGRWHLGVQVKNITSDVFIDPSKIRRPTEIYKKIVRQFEFCSRNGIIPILIAPFIDGSFYCFDDRHKGLHCQTFLQLFNPENRALCDAIRNVLKFGNVKVVKELPIHIQSWIERIPDMWTRRHGVILERPR